MQFCPIPASNYHRDTRKLESNQPGINLLKHKPQYTREAAEAWTWTLCVSKNCVVEIMTQSHSVIKKLKRTSSTCTVHAAQDLTERQRTCNVQRTTKCTCSPGNHRLARALFNDWRTCHAHGTGAAEVGLGDHWPHVTNEWCTFIQ